MKHGDNIFKIALVAWVSLCLMGLIASSCRTVGKSVNLGPMTQVNGIVLDEKNEPIIGANVYQEGKKIKDGTFTDFDGHFILSVPEGANIKVSCIGYKDAVVAAKDSITIILERDPNYKGEPLIVH